MMKTNNLFYGVGFLIALSVSCSSSDPKTDGEMHWQVPQSLQACDSNAECGEFLTCQCGVCTISCENGAACDGAPLPATCFDAPSNDACASAEAICLRTCGAGCADGLECVDDVCVDPAFDPTCAVDSDQDGIPDCDEAFYGLDPQSNSTFDDGIADGDRWFVATCPPPRIAGCHTCDIFRAGADLGVVDVLFMVDPSGSMTDDYARLFPLVDQLVTALSDFRVDARYAVTAIDDSSATDLPFGWRSSSTDLQTDVDTLQMGSPSFEEFGLRKTLETLNYISTTTDPDEMKRENASVHTLLFSDEEDNEVMDAGTCTTSLCPASIENTYLEDLTSQTTLHAIVAIDEQCGDPGVSYQRFATATGGEIANLCNVISLPAERIAASVSPFVATNALDDVSVFVDEMLVTDVVTGDASVWVNPPPSENSDVVIQYSCE